MILKYIPPLKSKHKTFIVISFFVILLTLIVLHTQYGKMILYKFSFAYAIYMVLVFTSLSYKHHIKLDEAKRKLTVTALLKKTVLDIDDISSINLIETKNAYLLSIETKGSTKEFSLSGSLSFEEPPFLAFLETIHQLKPEVGLNELAIGILKGTNKFTPWSQKMYYTYWTYIIPLVIYYVLMLLFLNIFT